MWSEESINKVGSLSTSRDFKAASAIAGAVFLPIGSRRMLSGTIFISRICSATRNLCSSLQINIGFLIPSR